MAVRVIDTDVWSYLYKGRDEAKLYEPHLFGNILVISFQTQAELFRGALAANWGAQRRQHLDSRLNKYVVEPSSYALSLRWAQVMDSAQAIAKACRHSSARRVPSLTTSKLSTTVVALSETHTGE